MLLVVPFTEVDDADPGVSLTIKGRIAAAQAYVLKQEFGRPAARKWFREHAPDKSCRDDKNMWRAIDKWGPHLEKHATLFDKPRSGRPPVISDEDAKELGRLMAAGYHIKHKRARLWRGFCSLKDTVENVEEAKEILGKYGGEEGVNLQSVMRRINKVVPWLAHCKRTVDFKTELDPETKEERAKEAAVLVKKALEELNGVVWIDAKKIEVSAPEGLKVYDQDTKRVVEDARLSKGKSRRGVITLHYYAAVNALVGVVTFVWVTGTTGLNKNMKTQASTSFTPTVNGCMGLYLAMVDWLGLQFMQSYTICLMRP